MNSGPRGRKEPGEFALGNQASKIIEINVFYAF
jgi:hypothetical protein